MPHVCLVKYWTITLCRQCALPLFSTAHASWSLVGSYFTLAFIVQTPSKQKNVRTASNYTTPATFSWNLLLGTEESRARSRRAMLVRHANSTWIEFHIALLMTLKSIAMHNAQSLLAICILFFCSRQANVTANFHYWLYNQSFHFANFGDI